MTDVMAIPILLSPDIGETAAYFEALGFTTEGFGDYLILRGQGLELHYSATEKPEACHETSCYIRGGGILDIYLHLRQKGAERLSPIYKRDWGMTEYYLHDPHGNLLKFGMSSDELPRAHQALEEVTTWTS